MNPKDIVKEFLKENKVMQLATVGKDGPWICNLYFVADEQNNIYWTSARRRQHSKEILDNPKVAVTVLHDAEHKRSVQVTGEAFVVALDDAERVNKLYANKFGDKTSRLQEVLANDPEGRAYWVLKPQAIYLWDEVTFPDNPKQQI